jgi:hypothetical protein
MGYYTKFNLTVTPDNGEIIPQFRKENENAEYALDDDGNFYEEAKWYYSQDELCEFSLKHPDVLFLLEGDGEDSENFWRLYVKNGKKHHQVGIVTYPEFDETTFADKINEVIVPPDTQTPNIINVFQIHHLTDI